MGRPVGQRHAQPGHREAADRPLGEGVTAPGLHRADVLLRHPPADDRRTELEAGPVQRFDVEDDMRELPRSAVLFDVPEDHPGHPAHDGFAVSHPGAADVDLHTGGLADLLHRDLQVQFAHAGQDRLPGLAVGAHGQRRVLLGQSGQRRGQPVGVGAPAGLDRHRDHRVGDRGRFEDERGVRRAQSRARAGRLESDHRDDVPGDRTVQPLVPVGLHPQDAPDPLGAPRARVPHRVPLLDRARIDPQISQPPGRGRAHLERQRSERQLRIGRPLLLTAVVRAPHRRDVRR